MEILGVDEIPEGRNMKTEEYMSGDNVDVHTRGGEWQRPTIRGGSQQWILLEVRNVGILALFPGLVPKFRGEEFSLSLLSMTLTVRFF